VSGLVAVLLLGFADRLLLPAPVAVCCFGGCSSSCLWQASVMCASARGLLAHLTATLSLPCFYPMLVACWSTPLHGGVLCIRDGPALSRVEHHRMAQQH
jgi:hypothetical protein